MAIIKICAKNLYIIEKSSIIDLNGRVITFTASEQDWFNSILG